MREDSLTYFADNSYSCVSLKGYYLMALLKRSDFKFWRGVSTSLQIVFREDRLLLKVLYVQGGKDRITK